MQDFILSSVDNACYLASFGAAIPVSYPEKSKAIRTRHIQLRWAVGMTLEFYHSIFNRGKAS
jgi:hypothetical protein